jgi:predicted DNA-binding WGR domain protein
MSTNINFKFIGWCKDTAENHDKVWAVIILREEKDTWGGSEFTYATVWGRRGKRLSHKVFTGTDWDMTKLISAKKNKGYFTVDKAKLDAVYPEFEEDLEKTTMWAMLCS